MVDLENKAGRIIRLVERITQKYNYSIEDMNVGPVNYLTRVMTNWSSMGLLGVSIFLITKLKLKTFDLTNPGINPIPTLPYLVLGLIGIASLGFVYKFLYKLFAKGEFKAQFKNYINQRLPYSSQNKILIKFKLIRWPFETLLLQKFSSRLYRLYSGQDTHKTRLDKSRKMAVSNFWSKGHNALGLILLVSSIIAIALSASFNIWAKSGAEIPGFLENLSQKSQNILNISIGIFVGLCSLLLLSKALFEIFDYCAEKRARTGLYPSVNCVFEDIKSSLSQLPLIGTCFRSTS